MKLSSRLETIASLIPKGVRVIDVGCDHALLDIYLTLNQTNPCVASDINPNVLVKTKEMIDSFGLLDKIEIVQSDGLKEISLQNEDVVVIAGMGTATILHILEEKCPSHLILESHTHLDELRKEVVKKGYMFEDEKVVFEKNIYYVVMVLKKGKVNYTSEELFLGPILMKQKNPEVLSYFEHLLEKKKSILAHVPELETLKQEICYLEAVLEK